MNQTETPISVVPKWITETINGGSSPVVDLNTGTNGFACPPSNVFPLRSVDFLKTKQKTPANDSLLSLVAVDWLKSPRKLNNVLSRPDNRVAHALRTAQSRGVSLNSFIFAVNFQVPTKEPYSLVFYFATEDPIPSDSLLHRFIDVEDDSFRNERFKLVSKVVKGPRVVKAVVGKFVGGFCLGKALKCSYHRGNNYFEIDVDLGSSAIIAAIMRLSLGYATSLRTDFGFVVEAQTEDELPEKLVGAVRVCGLELSSAFVVVDDHKSLEPCGRMMGSAKANEHEDDDNV